MEKYTTLTEAQEPTFSVTIPANWGRVVGYSSQGAPGYGADETAVLLEAEDGALRRVYFRGGLPSLTHVIRRGVVGGTWEGR